MGRLEDQIEVKSLEEVSLKGLTAAELSVVVKNDSRYRLKMTGAEVEIFMRGERLMSLEQVGESVAEGRSEGVVKTLWRIGGANPLTMLSYSSRLMKGEFEGMTLNYRAQLSANGIGRKVEGEGVNMKQFMGIFEK